MNLSPRLLRQALSPEVPGPGSRHSAKQEELGKVRVTVESRCLDVGPETWD